MTRSPSRLGIDKRRTIVNRSTTRAVAVAAAVVSVVGAGSVLSQPAGASTSTQAVYAYDTTHHSVVREALSGGRPTTVLSDVAQVDGLAVDSAANVYVLSGSSVTKIPAGGKPVPFATGVKAIAVDTDRKGDVFVQTTAPDQLLRYDALGHRTVVGASRGKFDVDAAGNVSQITVGNSSNIAITTYPVSGPASTRVVRARGERTNILSGAKGVIYFEQNTGGGAQYDYWSRVAAGSSKPKGIDDVLALYASSVGYDGTFYQAQSHGYCFPTSQCDPAKNIVERLLRFSAADGSLIAVPMTGFRFNNYAPTAVTISPDAAGNIVVNAGANDVPAILKYGSAGGSPTVLVSGTFTNMVVG